MIRPVLIVTSHVSLQQAGNLELTGTGGTGEGGQGSGEGGRGRHALVILPPFVGVGDGQAGQRHGGRQLELAQGVLQYNTVLILIPSLKGSVANTYRATLSETEFFNVS